MSSVEVEAKTVDEAIRQAVDLLGVQRERLRVEILADASRGIFGLGAQHARIRATVISDPETNVSRETVAASRGPGSIAAHAREVLEVLMAELVERPGIEDRCDEGRVRFELSGSSSGLLIGKGGRTLDALEHLVNRIVLREETGPASLRVELDVEGYRDRHADALAELARRSAEKAIETGRPVFLSPMNPRDRRLVHLALHGRVGVTTGSEGEGDFRRVVVRPAGPSGPLPTR